MKQKKMSRDPVEFTIFFQTSAMLCIYIFKYKHCSENFSLHHVVIH